QDRHLEGHLPGGGQPGGRAGRRQERLRPPQALMLTDAEITALPADVAKRAREGRAAAAARFKETVSKLSLSDKSHWLHLETEAPHLIPVEGGRDLVEHARGTIVTETAGKNDWIQTGEMVQIGSAWRLV